MRPTPPRHDSARREAERRRRRQAGHRRLALAVGLLVLAILAIGLGVGLSGRGEEPAATTTTTAAAGGPTTTAAGGPTTVEGESTTTVEGGSTTTIEGGSTTTSGTSPGGGQAAGPLTFTAQLAGQSQVPAVSTTATGTLTITVAADRSKVDYVLDVADIRNLTVARLHQGKAGENGETIVTIYPGPVKSGTFSGVLTRGSFTAADLVGPLEGGSIADFVALLQAGSVYLNVGTTAHRSGEIRGQLGAAPGGGQNGSIGPAVATFPEPLSPDPAVV